MSWILPDPGVAGRLYLAIEPGALVRSYDGGETWQDRGPDGPRDTHTLAPPTDARGRLYSAEGHEFTRVGLGYTESPDAGGT